ncbi:hypothetical protein AALP_AAs38884U000100, partial [Arabis alpina]
FYRIDLAESLKGTYASM